MRKLRASALNRAAANATISEHRTAINSRKNAQRRPRSFIFQYTVMYMYYKVCALWHEWRSISTRSQSLLNEFSLNLRE